MNIINKFKINYNQKLFDDLLINNKQEEARSMLKEIKVKNKELFFHLLKHFIYKYKSHPIKENFFKKQNSNSKLFILYLQYRQETVSKRC